jgi:hypothetical protein
MPTAAACDTADSRSAVVDLRGWHQREYLFAAALVVAEQTSAAFAALTVVWGALFCRLDTCLENANGLGNVACLGKASSLSHVCGDSLQNCGLCGSRLCGIQKRSILRRNFRY